MIHLRTLSSLLLTALLVATAGCEDREPVDLLFTVEDDKTLGLQLKEEIDGNPQEYPILDRETYADAYAYLENLRDQVLESEPIRYRDEFTWEVHIIDADVLNAFAAPGGYIYFYTGLIKYLDEEDALMGVMGHEIAHADRRHSVKQMTKTYGVQTLLSIALGNNASGAAELAAQIAGTGAALKFSRSDETEADAYSVEYLSGTPYRCDAAAIFFEKISEQNDGVNIPQILSTHPSPENRVEDIRAKAEEVGCSTETFNPTSYADFKAMLP